MSSAELREFDRKAVEVYHIPSCILMENAGRAATDIFMSTMAPAVRNVLIVCGNGNNGGDGLVMARHLLVRGLEPTIVRLDPAKPSTPDARLQGEIVTALGITQVAFDDHTPDSHLADWAVCSDCIIDALLGTGTSGPPRLSYARAIRILNSSGKPIFAIDIPSGLDCDTGAPQEPTIRATITCTMVAPKLGFTNPSAGDYVGTVQIVDIGV